jgi:pyrroloquinoline-quinone synthase
MSQRLLDTLAIHIQERHMLKHPFYQAWSEGILTSEMLRAYACQYYHFVKDFPRMVSAVHSNIPDLSLRTILLRNLMDEELGADNHPALWLRFAKAIGATEDTTRNTTPLPTTIDLVKTMMEYCRNGSYQEGLASLYAYESQIPEVSQAKIHGLKIFYGLTDPEAFKFFSVHEEADVYHSREEADLIERTTPPSSEPLVEQAVVGTTQALWRFLDGVYEQSCASLIPDCKLVAKA